MTNDPMRFVPFDRDVCERSIPQRFVEQAERHPDRPAVIAADEARRRLDGR